MRPLLGQKLTVGNCKFGGKLAAENVKVRRIVVVEKDHNA